MALEDTLLDFKAREGESDIFKANWYNIAAVSLAAASAGHEVPKLYRLATKDEPLLTQKLIQRRIKEAILKTSGLFGGPKMLQALFPLFRDLKDEEIDHYGPRYQSLGSEEAMQARQERGRRFFQNLWTPEAAKANMDFNFKHSPDLYLMVTMNLEWYVAEDSILDFVETELVMAAALICSNAPEQAMWHTRGIVRQGGTMEQAKLVQEMALRIAAMYDCKTGVITPVDEIDFADKMSHE